MLIVDFSIFSTANTVIGLCRATKSVGLWRKLCASLLYLYFVVRVRYRRKKVHVRYLISWWVSLFSQTNISVPKLMAPCSLWKFYHGSVIGPNNLDFVLLMFYASMLMSDYSCSMFYMRWQNCYITRNSSRDEIANMNCFTTTSYTYYKIQ